jgi:hypothetical protein
MAQHVSGCLEDEVLILAVELLRARQAGTGAGFQAKSFR